MISIANFVAFHLKTSFSLQIVLVLNKFSSKGSTRLIFLLDSLYFNFEVIRLSYIYMDNLLSWSRPTYVLANKFPTNNNPN